MSFRSGCLILLSALGGVGAASSVACTDKHLHVGDDGSGGHAGSGGQSGSGGGGRGGSGGGQAGGAGGAAGAGGSIAPSGAAGTGGTTGAGGSAAATGTGGSAGTTGAGGAVGQAGTGGAATGNGLSVNPSSATFASTLVEWVSAAQTFTVRNDGAATAALAALQGTSAGDFRITANGCGATLQPGASCDVVVAFAPKIRSGARSASLAISSSSSPGANVSLSGTALPSLTLLAGAIGGPGYANGTGKDARFSYPVGVAADGAGNLFVADSGNSTVRKIAIATGAVTAFVGAPRQPGGADGIGAAAAFTELKAISADGAGNLYVIDDNGIREIVIATGAVTTVMDDNGAPVQFNSPVDVTADGAGTLYVSDLNPASSFLDAQLRHIALATGTITTVADRTGVSVHFNGLYGVVSDRAGGLYVADADVVNRVVIATGDVNPVASSLGAPTSLALDGAGSLFIAGGQSGGIVEQYVIATSARPWIAGGWQNGSDDGIGAAASFAFPSGMALDGAGSLFVADNYNHTIRKIVVATGAVSTFAGMTGHEMTLDGTGAAARFGSPVGIAGDGAGNLYVADRDSSSIRKIVVATGAVTVFAGAGPSLTGNTDGIGTSATFLSPTGIAGDGAGNLYVTDGGTIRKIVIATRAVTTLAGAANQSGTADGVGAAARFYSPWAIASDGTNNLYIADSNSTIRKIVIATRAVTTLAGKPDETGSVDAVGAAARFYYPSGIAADGAGNVFVADSGNDTIRKIVVATGAVTTFAGKAGEAGSADGTGAAARFSTLGGIASDGAGNLYVLDGTVRKIAIDSATVSTVIGTPGRSGVMLGGLPASLNLPIGLAVLPTGELAIVDNIESSVLMGHL